MTDADIDYAYALKCRGATWAEIGARLHYSGRWLSMSVTRRYGPWPRIRQAEVLASAGASWEVIAAHLGYASRQTARDAVRRNPKRRKATSGR